MATLCVTAEAKATSFDTILDTVRTRNAYLLMAIHEKEPVTLENLEHLYREEQHREWTVTQGVNQLLQHGFIRLQP